MEKDKEVGNDEFNRRMCRKIKNNDLLAENKLLMANEGLIVGLADEIVKKFGIDYTLANLYEKDEIVQEGRMAMLTAAKKFDETRGVKFSTFAYEVMKNAMIDLCEKGVSTFARKLEADGITLLYLGDKGSTEQALYGRGSDVHYQDPTGNLAVLHVMLEKMHNRLKLLPPRLQRFLTYYYGIGTIEAKSISEAASYFHLSENYARKLEKQGLDKMREMMNDGKIV